MNGGLKLVIWGAREDGWSEGGGWTSRTRHLESYTHCGIFSEFRVSSALLLESDNILYQIYVETEFEGIICTLSTTV